MATRDYVDWNYWIGKDYWSSRQPVEPWQACALSVGIEPKSMTADHTDYSLGPGVSVVWGPQPSGIKQSTLGEFERRLSLLCHDKDDPRFFTRRDDGKLFLDEFVEWANEKGIHAGIEMSELVAKPRQQKEWRDIRADLDASETDTYQHLPRSESEIALPEDKDPSVSPDVRTEPDPIPRRRDILSHPIEMAYQSAKAKHTVDVFVELRKLAVAKTAPFVGEIAADGALVYLDDDGHHAKIKKEALGKRLKRRAGKRVGKESHLPTLTAAKGR